MQTAEIGDDNSRIAITRRNRALQLAEGTGNLGRASKPCGASADEKGKPDRPPFVKTGVAGGTRREAADLELIAGEALLHEDPCHHRQDDRQEQRNVDAGAGDQDRHHRVILEHHRLRKVKPVGILPGTKQQVVEQLRSNEAQHQGNEDLVRVEPDAPEGGKRCP